jgi:hypothetical protein
VSQINFLGIGAQKAGTTWLYSALQLHPEAMLHPIKELHFFDCKYADRTAVWRRRTVAFKCLVNHVYPIFHGHNNLYAALTAEQVSPNKSVKALDRCRLRANLRLALGSYSDEMYPGLFAGLSGKVVGEITPAYSSLPPNAVKSIRTLLGDIKIIYMLRHPVSRAWSSFKMLCRNTGLDISLLDGEDVLKTLNDRRVLRYLDSRSAYDTTTALWESFFSNMHFIMYDDLVESPSRVLQGACEFLQIGFEEGFFGSILSKRVNQGEARQPPENVVEFLADRYRTQIDFVESRFGQKLSL